MFSTLKFVLAGAIVALSGGFLLVTNAAPDVAERDSPTGRYEAALASLTLEEVAPGISRVIGDDGGVWESNIERAANVAFGPDGTIWVVSGDGGGTRRLRRIDREGGVALPDMGDIFDIAVGPDDRLWVAALRGLATFDGEVWEEDRVPVKSFGIMLDDEPWALRISGTVEAMEVRPMAHGGFEVRETSSLEGGEVPSGAPLWVRYDGDSAGDIAVTTGRDIWVGAQLVVDGWLARSHGGSWSLERPLGDTPFGVHALAAAPDGALWALLMIEHTAVHYDGHRCCEPILARFDNDHWTTWAFEDGLPLSETYVWYGVGGLSAVNEPGTPFTVAPDGTLWMGDVARGVVSFDGSLFRTYETGPASEWGQGNATEIAFAPDGTVWAVVWKEYDAGLYIIDPEAVQ